MRDIVYFLKEDIPYDGIELRYSLRTLKNLPHDKVWFVGPTVPDWVQGVIHVPWTQLEPKFYDLQEKFKALHRYADPDMRDEVYVMHDDVYVIKPMDEVPLYWYQSVKGWVEPSSNNHHAQALHRTYWRLRALRWKDLVVPVIHQPVPVERSRIPVEVDIGKGPYCWQMIWINYVRQQGEETVDLSGYSRDGRVVETKARTGKELKVVLDRGSTLLSSQEGYHDVVIDYLKKRFPERSPYEL